MAVLDGLACLPLTHCWTPRGCWQCWGEGIVTRYQVLILLVGRKSVVSLVLFFSCQALSLREPQNTRLTCYQTLYHLLRGSAECYLWNLLRLENSWMTTSARNGLGPAPLLLGPQFFFLGKKNESLKICIDCRALNKQTILNKYPLPRIDNLLDWLANVHCFISIELYTGYH